MNSVDFEAATQKFFDSYHRKIKSNSTLYCYSSTTYQICYPITLQDYIMDGTGNHGENSGYAPIGTPILTSKNSYDEVAGIFSSVESLREFILSNRGRYNRQQYVKNAAKTKNKTITVTFNNESARKIFWTKADKSKYDSMTVKYGKECVDRDLINLTWNEFDLRYGVI
jgi:hypothetical protein